MEAIYARQSIDKKESISIEGQIELCLKECKLPETAKIYKDKGFSGKNTKRPEFEHMLQDVKEGKINKIIVYRLDRFSRSITDFSRIWVQLEQKGVEFISVNERFDTTTPMGKAMLYIIMVFAQLERETIAERVKDNYYQRSKRGSWPGGPAPYGYKNVKKQETNGQMLATLEATKELEVVERIFKDYSKEGVSLGSIAKQLTIEEVGCRNRKHWDNVAISRILHNPIYVKADQDIYLYYVRKGVKITNDLIEFDGVHAAHIIGKRTSAERKYTDLKHHMLSLTNIKGVVSSEIWLKCQHKLNKNAQIKNTGKGQYTWLAGILKCGRCGYAISIKYSKKLNKYYLGCSGHLTNHVCNVIHYEHSLQEIEAIMEKEIEHFLKQYTFLKKQFVEDKTNTIINLKEEVLLINRKIENLIRAMADSTDISIFYINQAIETLEHDKNRLLQQLELNKMDIPHTEISFAKLSFEEKKFVVSILVDKICIDGDYIEIIWNV